MLFLIRFAEATFPDPQHEMPDGYEGDPTADGALRTTYAPAVLTPLDEPALVGVHAPPAWMGTSPAAEWLADMSLLPYPLDRETCPDGGPWAGAGFRPVVLVTPEGYDPDEHVLGAGDPASAVYDPDADAVVLTRTMTDRPTPPRPTTYTRSEFRRLFTPAERAAFDNYQSGAWSDEQRAMLTTIHEDLRSSTTVDRTHADTAQAVVFLESIGLIAEGRAAQVLAGDPAG